MKMPHVNGGAAAAGIVGAALLAVGLWLFAHKQSSDPPTIYYDSGGGEGGGGGGFTGGGSGGGGSRPTHYPSGGEPGADRLPSRAKDWKGLIHNQFSGGDPFSPQGDSPSNNTVAHARLLAGLQYLGYEDTMEGGLGNAG